MITRKTTINSDLNFLEGEIVLLDKALYKSSFDCTYKVRKAVRVQKVGHAGTLDPMATGLMIICTGKKTKEISEIQNSQKTYTGVITLGKTTLSFDTETEFHSEKDFSGVTEEDIYNIRDLFIGKILQTPPMYSAIKKNGKALYHFARRGIEVERNTREVVIDKFEITKINLPDIHFTITCSKGTYIRVIANDFGEKLGCGAYLKSLRRIRIGNYSVDDALTVNEFLTLIEAKKVAESEVTA